MLRVSLKCPGDRSNGLFFMLVGALFMVLGVAAILVYGLITALLLVALGLGIVGYGFEVWRKEKTNRNK